MNKLFLTGERPRHSIVIGRRNFLVVALVTPLSVKKPATAVQFVVSGIVPRIIRNLTEIFCDSPENRRPASNFREVCWAITALGVMIDITAFSIFESLGFKSFTVQLTVPGNSSHSSSATLS